MMITQDSDIKYDFLIVGAGLYGSICAYELTRKRYKCLVIDSRPHVAGNIYTENFKGIDVHVHGPHIFHTSDRFIWDYINQFAHFNNFIYSPLANYNGEIYNLPFNMNTFHQLWDDVITPEEAKRRIEQSRLDIKEPKNLKEYAISQVGVTLYNKLISGYTEKQWGRKCEELPTSIIKRIPLRFTYDNNYFNDTYQGIPFGGYTRIIEKMLEGVDVRLNYDFYEHKDELSLECDKIIFTGQIDKFFDYKYGTLEYRTVDYISKVLDVSNYQGVAVVNYTGRESFNRVIEHKHFMQDNWSPVTVVTAEYSTEWTKDKEPYYPINDEKNNELYQKYKDIKVNKLYFGGRLGTYQYLDMDDTIKQALEFCSTWPYNYVDVIL